MKIPKLDIGPTGKFPKGKIHESDRGELKFAVTSFEGQVILAFGKPVDWIGLPPEIAMDLARLLQAKAHEAQGGRTQ